MGADSKLAKLGPLIPAGALIGHASYYTLQCKRCGSAALFVDTAMIRCVFSQMQLHSLDANTMSRIDLDQCTAPHN